jgi:hypothetical protein
MRRLCPETQAAHTPRFSKAPTEAEGAPDATGADPAGCAPWNPWIAGRWEFQVVAHANGADGAVGFL